MENATVIIARGVIKAVGKDAAIPDEAWVVEGKGLIVYPGFIDSFTDVGIPPGAQMGTVGDSRGSNSVKGA